MQLSTHAACCFFMSLAVASHTAPTAVISRRPAVGGVLSPKLSHGCDEASSQLMCAIHCPQPVQGIGKRKTYTGSWIETLNKAGYSCAGIDNRGSGRSGGLFGYINDHTDWVNDLVSSSNSSCCPATQPPSSGMGLQFSSVMHRPATCQQKMHACVRSLLLVLPWLVFDAVVNCQVHCNCRTCC